MSALRALYKVKGRMRLASLGHSRSLGGQQDLVEFFCASLWSLNSGLFVTVAYQTIRSTLSILKIVFPISSLSTGFCLPVPYNERNAA